ncbi:aminoacyl--tRNA ligase-related protein [Streptomyces sp. NPDC006602]|uniref:aminoacyl--tRNA ligase-related protein n=1 Tax=Streptomyces sp. NPDC006602 TaxID=3364751 RepID=UPI003675C44B
MKVLECGLDVGAVKPDAYDRLVAGGWLRPTSVAGLLNLTSKFETAVARLQAALTAADPSDSPGPLWCPPVVPREVIERAEYAESFPQLLGAVHTLGGEEAVAGDAASPTDVVLAPASCYAIYPQVADSTLAEPVFFDVVGHCYRQEATSEVGRFRSFRQREFVVIADDGYALQWRDEWLARGEELLTRLGLTIEVQPANDPFFGPVGEFMRVSQLQQCLKFELVTRVSADDPGTAVASVNSHRDHLGHRFGIRFGRDGEEEPAHSSCTAFGIERVVLALIHAHGDDLDVWPDFVESR